MIDLGATIEQMKASGMTADEIVRALACVQVAQTPVSDQRSSAAKRQARYRERHKALRDVTSDVSDVTPSPSPKEVSPAPLQEITPSQPTTPKENPLRGQKKAVRLPADFAPDLVWATEQGLTPSQAETEAAKFRDYWTAKGRDAAKSDWPATWRNWVRTALERLPRQRAGPAPKFDPMKEASNRLMEKLDAVTSSETQANPAHLRLVAYSGGNG